MTSVILDCYTDEPAGLGVPPYLGTYPRYLAGRLNNTNEEWRYITIDDLRLWKRYGKKIHEPKPHESTNISVYNLTGQDAEDVIGWADTVYAIIGVHTPGKYLSAVPGTIKELVMLLEGIDKKIVLCGPGAFGSASEGGRHAERIPTKFFTSIDPLQCKFEEVKDISVT